MVISLRHNNVLKHFIAGEAYNEQEAREQFANSTDLFSEMNMVDSASPFIDCIYLFNENGEWVTTKPLEIHKDLTYPNIGPRDSYLLYHEELESLVKNFPTIKRARFWMTFGQEYLTHLRVIQNIGMARIDEVEYNGMKIVPLQFLKAVLPNPQDLGENYEGETSIGCRIRGLKDGKERTYYVYNNCSHQEAYKETGMQGVSYTTGVPAMIGAMMFLKGLWKKPGVWNVEEFNPDPFMEQLNKQGLPWHEIIDGDLEVLKLMIKH